jgi:autoinducer 2-binding protein LuxP
MYRVILSFLVLSTLLFSKDFFTIDEYRNIHQEEVKKMALFDKIVQEKPNPIRITQKQPIKISMIYPAGELSDYWTRSKKAFERRLELLKINYEIDHHYLDSNNLIEKNKKCII